MKLVKINVFQDDQSVQVMLGLYELCFLTTNLVLDNLYSGKYKIGDILNSKTMLKNLLV